MTGLSSILVLNNSCLINPNCSASDVCPDNHSRTACFTAFAAASPLKPTAAESNSPVLDKSSIRAFKSTKFEKSLLLLFNKATCLLASLILLLNSD